MHRRHGASGLEWVTAAESRMIASPKRPMPSTSSVLNATGWYQRGARARPRDRSIFVPMPPASDAAVAGTQGNVRAGKQPG